MGDSNVKISLGSDIRKFALGERNDYGERLTMIKLQKVLGKFSRLHFLMWSTNPFLVSRG